ncbi:hypothetical protein HWV62_20720 [Athelia sp. TMB]|nr:hypothetical protein HWV62_20720 [Athelia sp. TMB]
MSALTFLARATRGSQKFAPSRSRRSAFRTTAVPAVAERAGRFSAAYAAMPLLLTATSVPHTARVCHRRTTSGDSLKPIPAPPYVPGFGEEANSVPLRR